MERPLRSWEAAAVELMLKDGDYIPAESGGLRKAEGNDELLQRVLWKLSVRRGSFPFLPELGSRLYLLPREKPGMRLSAARQYVEEALAEETGLHVTGVTLEAGAEETMALTVQMEYEGQRLTGSVTVK